MFGASLDASAAAQLIRHTIPTVCREYAGKGSGGWQPPRVVSQEDWRSYGDVERRFYSQRLRRYRFGNSGPNEAAGRCRLVDAA